MEPPVAANWSAEEKIVLPRVSRVKMNVFA
jgi:hypothetical protein